MIFVFYKNEKILKNVEIDISERNDTLIWKEAPPMANKVKFKLNNEWQEIRRTLLFHHRTVKPLTKFQKFKFKILWFFNPLKEIRWSLIDEYLNEIFNDAEIDYLGQLFQSPNKNILDNYKEAILNSNNYKLKKFDVTLFDNLGFRPKYYI